MNHTGTSLITIGNFDERPHIYLVAITETDYKFGMIVGLDNKNKLCFNKYRKLGLNPKIIKVWHCKTTKIMKNAMNKINSFAAKHKMNNKYNQKLISTNNIELVIKNVTSIVKKQNLHYTTDIRIKKLKLEIKMLEAEIQNIELRNKKLKLKYISQQLKRQNE